jgi:ABC-type dipeptide/oligopeptide/nickel transport system permease subunit
MTKEQPIALDQKPEDERSLRQRSYWEDAWHRFSRDRFALFGGVIVLMLIAISIGAPLVSPYDPLKQFPEGLTQRGMPVSGSSQFLLGTDVLGRDLLSRLIWGGRISITVGVFANVFSIGIALILGGVAGYFGGWLDMLVMRAVDIALSLPSFLLMIALATVLPPSVGTVVLVISIFAWAYPSRVFRGQVLSIRQKAFIEAAHCVGASEFRIFFLHVVPQLLPTLIVYFTIRVPSAILTEAGLSFLGLGVAPPTPSWGNLIQEGSKMYRSAPWIVLYPGLCIMLTVLSFNLLGDGLRDALDPRERR